MMARMRALHDKCSHFALCARSLHEEGKKLFDDFRAIIQDPLPPGIEGAMSCHQDAADCLLSSCVALKELVQFAELRAQCVPIRTRMLQAAEASSAAAMRARLYGQSPNTAATHAEVAEQVAGKKRGREENK